MRRTLHLLLIGALILPAPTAANADLAAAPRGLFDAQALSAIGLNSHRSLSFRARIPLTTFALAVVTVGFALGQSPTKSSVDTLIDQLLHRPEPKTITLDTLRATIAGLAPDERILLFRSYRVVGPQWILDEIEVRQGKDDAYDVKVSLTDIPPIPGKLSFSTDRTYDTSDIPASELLALLDHPEKLPAYVEPPRPRGPMRLFPQLGPAHIPIATSDHPFGRLLWEDIDHKDNPTLTTVDPLYGGTVTFILINNEMEGTHTANTPLQRQVAADFAAMLKTADIGGWPVYLFFGQARGLGIFNAADTEILAIKLPDGTIHYGVAVYFNEDRLVRSSPKSQPYTRAEVRNAQADYWSNKTAAFHNYVSALVDGWFGNTNEQTAQRTADTKWLDALLRKPLPSIQAPDDARVQPRRSHHLFDWLWKTLGMAFSGGFLQRTKSQKIRGEHEKAARALPTPSAGLNDEERRHRDQRLADVARHIWEQTQKQRDELGVKERSRSLIYTVSRLPALAERLVNEYVALAHQRGLSPGTIELYLTGGRLKQKKLRENTDLDVKFHVSERTQALDAQRGFSEALEHFHELAHIPGIPTLLHFLDLGNHTAYELADEEHLLLARAA